MTSEVEEGLEQIEQGLERVFQPYRYIPPHVLSYTYGGRIESMNPNEVRKNYLQLLLLGLTGENLAFYQGRFDDRLFIFGQGYDGLQKEDHQARAVGDTGEQAIRIAVATAPAVEKGNEQYWRYKSALADVGAAITVAFANVGALNKLDLKQPIGPQLRHHALDNFTGRKLAGLYGEEFARGGANRQIHPVLKDTLVAIVNELILGQKHVDVHLIKEIAIGEATGMTPEVESEVRRFFAKVVDRYTILRVGSLALDETFRHYSER